MMVSFPIAVYSKTCIFYQALCSSNSKWTLYFLDLQHMNLPFPLITECYMILKAEPKHFESKEHFPFHFLYTRGDAC